jgi:hypothetical protein
MRRKGGREDGSCYSYEYGTHAIEAGLFLNFGVVFSSMFFRFRQVQTNY